MTWLRIIYQALSILGAVVSYLQERKVIDAALASALSAHLQGAQNEIDRANVARQAAHDRLAEHPDELHDDDGFRRD